MGVDPYWCKDKPKPPPINAKAETVDRLPMVRERFRKRRCIEPIDGFNTHGWGAQMSIILGAVYLLASGLVNRAMLKSPA